MDKNKIIELSKVSKIEIKDSEAQDYIVYLENYIKDIKNLEKLVIQGKPIDTNTSQIFRSDKAKNSLDLDSVFKNTNYRRYSYFEIADSKIGDR